MFKASSTSCVPSVVGHRPANDPPAIAGATLSNLKVGLLAIGGAATTGPNVAFRLLPV